MGSLKVDPSAVHLGAHSRVKDKMRIGQLAAATGVSTDTLRFYEKLNLIASSRTGNGYRAYADETVSIVSYIRTAQRLGFTLKEIAVELPQLEQGTDQTERLQHALEEKIAAIDSRIAELAILRRELERRLELACPMRPAPEAGPASGPGSRRCP